MALNYPFVTQEPVEVFCSRASTVIFTYSILY